MTFDHELILNGTTMGENDMGDPIKITTRRSVLCAMQSVTRNEHYQAAAHGVKPSLVFIVNRYEYQGEAKAEFDGRQYNVVRTYMTNRPQGRASRAPNLSEFENIELICEGVE